MKIYEFEKSSKNKVGLIDLLLNKYGFCIMSFLKSEDT